MVAKICYYFTISHSSLTNIFYLLHVLPLPKKIAAEVSKGLEKYKTIAQELEYAELNNY